MSTRRVEFRLTMNGRWSGEDELHTIVRRVSAKQVAELGIAEDRVGRWYHRWDDGWSACVVGRLMQPGERAKKSVGLRGYDWMVNSILLVGRILYDDELREALPKERPTT